MHILDAILGAVAGLIAVRYVWGLVNEAERKAAADAALERAVEAYKARLVASRRYPRDAGTQLTSPRGHTPI